MKQRNRTFAQTGTRSALACLALAALLLVLAGPGGAGENGDPAVRGVGPELLSTTFCTPSGQPWIISRETGPAAKILRAPGGTAFNLRGLGTLRVYASREKSGGEVVRLRWLVESRVGGLYMAAAPVNIPASGSHDVALDTSDDSPELVPLGHQRPWDDISAAEVLALELRAECYFPPTTESDEPIRLVLSQARLEKDKFAAKPAVILDLALHTAPVEMRAKAVLKFRIEPPPRDPYAAAGEGDVRVSLPGGREVPAFYDQEYYRVEDGRAKRNVAAGRPYWCAYLPEVPSAGALVISSGARRWRVPLENLAATEALVQSYDAESAAEAAQETERWEVPLEVPVPELRPSGAGWPSLWCLSGSGAWQAAEPVKAAGGKMPQALWRPAPFWNRAWGSFSGASRPDDAFAVRMDAVLARAALAGQAQPLVILDGEMFGAQGTFNWGSHPLKAGVAGPGELLRSAQGVDFCLRWVRYCVARWGASRAASAL